MDYIAYKRRSEMTQFVYNSNSSAKYFFPLPNELFDLGLNVYEIAIYAYLMRIEDRKTFQSYASYYGV